VTHPEDASVVLVTSTAIEWHICHSSLNDIYVSSKWVTYMSLDITLIQWHICHSLVSDIYVTQKNDWHICHSFCSGGHQNDWRVFWMRHKLVTYMSLFTWLGPNKISDIYVTPPGRRCKWRSLDPGLRVFVVWAISFSLLRGSQPEKRIFPSATPVCAMDPLRPGSSALPEAKTHAPGNARFSFSQANIFYPR
jgi:hypothetical protein